MILVSNPTGSNVIKALLTNLEKNNLLYKFETCVAINKNNILIRNLPKKIKDELIRRYYPINQNKISQNKPSEFLRVLLQRLDISRFSRTEKNLASNYQAYKILDKRVAKKIPKLKDKISGVFCTEDCALETFKEAKKYGLKCYYELPIGYWREGKKIQQEESKIKPEYASTMPLIKDSLKKLKQKDKELELADVIFVPSSFVKETLKDVKTKAKIIINPFGVEKTKNKKTINKKGKLKLIYVGSITQRKGISYLFDAMKKLENKAKLTVIGLKNNKNKRVNEELSKHRYIPSLPNKKIIEEMRKHDLLVFPSLFEGFGLVILEAMSQGLPVISTKNTAAREIIEDGKDGFIVPIRSSTEIVKKINKIYKDRKKLEKMSLAAQRKSEKFTWEKYGSKIIKEIRK